MKPEEVIRLVSHLCHKHHAKEVILFGSRAKGTAYKKSDIDIAVTGVKDFNRLQEEIEDLPTLYSVDLIDLDACENKLLKEDILNYGRKI